MITESQAVEIAVRHVREKKIDGKFNGVYSTEFDGSPTWCVLIELNGVAPEAECLYGEISVLVDATTGIPEIMKNL
jgi:hypothetical protein